MNHVPRVAHRLQKKGRPASTLHRDGRSPAMRSDPTWDFWCCPQPNEVRASARSSGPSTSTLHRPWLEIQRRTRDPTRDFWCYPQPTRRAPPPCIDASPSRPASPAVRPRPNLGFFRAADAQRPARVCAVFSSSALTLHQMARAPAARPQPAWDFSRCRRATTGAYRPRRPHDVQHPPRPCFIGIACSSR
jgi:hypothetical protein